MRPTVLYSNKRRLAAAVSFCLIRFSSSFTRFSYAWSCLSMLMFAGCKRWT